MRNRRFLVAAATALAASVVVGACGGTEDGENGFTVSDSPDASASGGTPGVFGTGGSVGASGSAGTSPGSCNPMFCPDVGGGTRCCVGADGPCGVDTGTGCVSMIGNPDGG